MNILGRPPFGQPIAINTGNLLDILQKKGTYFSGEFIHEHFSYRRDEGEHASFLCAALGSTRESGHSAALPGLSASLRHRTCETRENRQKRDSRTGERPKVQPP